MPFVPAESKPASRTVWIDCCKGICILFVVYGHVTGGLEAGRIINAGTCWLLLRDWVYLFHMPTFFFLSGLFAAKAASQPAGTFLRGKMKTIAYPYVAWTAIYVAAQYAMASHVNHPPELRRALRLFTEPYGYGLWFLYALFVVSLLYYLAARMKIHPGAILAAGIGLALAASAKMFDFWPILNTTMAFFGYYAAGAFLSGKILSANARANPWLLAFAGTCLMMLMAILQLFGLTANGTGELLAAFLGIMAVVCLAMSVAQTFLAQFWVLLGLFSLEIYLGHPLWSTLARALMIKAGVATAAACVFASLGLGIAGSLAVGFLCRKWNFPWLFRWP